VSEPAAAAEEGKVAKPKSKKLIIIIALVVVLVAAGVGGWLFLAKKSAQADDAEGEDAPAAAAKADPKAVPAFLPLESLVVNLADPGGERMAQIGITIELSDAHAVDKVKVYMPTIRSSILMLVSQRTSTELLALEGKEKLAADIKREVSRPLGFAEDEHEPASAPKGTAKKKKAKDAHGEGGNPVSKILFSSFIVQ
jgi:flagellar FliL protein